MAYDKNLLKRMTGSLVSMPYDTPENEPIDIPQGPLSTSPVFGKDGVKEEEVQKTPDVKIEPGFNVEEELKKYKDFNPEQDEKLQALEKNVQDSQLTDMEKREPEFARFAGGLQRMVGALGVRGQEANQMAAANISDAERAKAERQAMLGEAMKAAQTRRGELQGQREQILKNIGVQRGMEQDVREKQSFEQGLEMNQAKLESVKKELADARNNDALMSAEDSPVSLAVKDYFQNTLGMKVPEHSTAKSLQMLMPYAEKAYAAKQAQLSKQSQEKKDRIQVRTNPYTGETERINVESGEVLPVIKQQGSEQAAADFDPRKYNPKSAIAQNWNKELKEANRDKAAIEKTLQEIEKSQSLLATAQNNPMARSAVQRDVAMQFNKGALSEQDVAAFTGDQSLAAKAGRIYEKNINGMPLKDEDLRDAEEIAKALLQGKTTGKQRIIQQRIDSLNNFVAPGAGDYWVKTVFPGFKAGEVTVNPAATSPTTDKPANKPATTVFKKGSIPSLK